MYGLNKYTFCHITKASLNLINTANIILINMLSISKNKVLYLYVLALPCFVFNETLI